MSDEECEHGSLRSSCPPCRNAAAPKPAKARPVATIRFTAKHPGTCRGCDLPIVEGQEIARNPDGSYTHAGRCEP